MHLMQMMATQSYWLPAERAEQERTARKDALVAQARQLTAQETPSRPQRQALIPRIAGALGLF